MPQEPSDEAKRTQIVKVERAGVQRVERRSLFDAWLAGKSPQTVRAYREDMAAFALFIGVGGAAEAVKALAQCTHPEAVELAFAFQAHLKMQKGPKGEPLSSSTINRRMSSLRSVVQLANTLGYIPWLLKIPRMKSERVRDSRGPTDTDLGELLKAVEEQATPKRERDVAVVMIAATMGLRRAEIAALSVDDYDSTNRRVRVLGKGRRQKQYATVPDATAVAIDAWIPLRRVDDVRLFQMTASAIYEMLKRTSAKAGVRQVRPHGLRHSAVTTALDVEPSLRVVQKFSRHANTNVLLDHYDDSREDHFGIVANKVADRVDRMRGRKEVSDHDDAVAERLKNVEQLRLGGEERSETSDHREPVRGRDRS